MGELWKEYGLGIPRDAMIGAFYARVLLLGILGIMSFGFLAHPLDGEDINSNFLHGVNLIIHEAGHVVFSFFGALITSLGGSLLQCLMPLVFCGTLLIQQRDGFASSVAFWWFAQNLQDLTPYIADAQAGILPLLGGNTGEDSPYGFHDWNFILTELHLIQFDVAIAWFVHWCGALCMLGSLVWGGWVMVVYWQKLHPAPEREEPTFYVG